MRRRRPNHPPDAAGPLRIHAVAELLGVPSTTLRAWERRYGVPTPGRTASAYRLYGPSDIAMLREMQRLCAAGVSTGEAARKALASAPADADAPAEVNVYDAAADRIIDACRRFDAAAIDAELARASLLGSAHEVYERVLGPALVKIGRMWHEGALSVAQEHLASERVVEKVRAEVRLLQPVSPSATVLVACFADEEHALGSLGAALAFVSAGCRTITLGARTPPVAVADVLRTIDVDLVGLSITVAPPPARARELLGAYATACGSVPWVVGGTGAAALGDLVREAGGFVAQGDARAWMKHARDWLRGPRRGATRSRGRRAPALRG